MVILFIGVFMEQNKISGVYKITNNITGDFYIGSSKNIKYRWANHKSPSQWKHQPNSKLYKDIASYGLDNFTFEVLEETADLKEREQYWIEHLKPSYNNNWAQGQDAERYKETHKRYTKDYYNRLCFYEGETLTLDALSRRFFLQGIPHPCKEAKKYLI